jgi:spore coat protein CotH
MSRRWLSVITLIVVFLSCDVREARGQAGAELFDSSTLHEIRLRMNARDLANLREWFEENTFYPADVMWGDVRVRNVAVRSRGTATRNPTKLGLLLDFDRYVSGQELAGQRSLVLDNFWQDPSMLREHLAMNMFARMGQPAPRTAYARLYINDEYQGLYGIVEAIEQPFLARVLDEPNGYLFEYKFITPFYGDYLGESLESYKPLFEPRTRALESDATLYGPIHDLFREANEAGESEWRERVEQYLDLTQFVTHAAIENFIAEDDGVIGYAGMANFYLYRPDGQPRHRVFPWDKDHAFSQVEFPIFQRRRENVLFRRAMGYRDLRGEYLTVLRRSARGLLRSNWLVAEIDRIVEQIGPSVLEDTRKPFTNDEFVSEVAFIRAFADKRPSYVLDALTPSGR